MTDAQARAVESIIQINLIVDLMNAEPEIIDYLKEAFEAGKKQVSTGYAFPMVDYSKIDVRALENKTLEAILNLCETRKNQIEETRKIGSRKTLDGEVLRALGLK